VLRFERPKQRLLGTEDLDGGTRRFGEVHDGASVGNESCADELANERCEVGCESLHACRQVV
jgi:hypothetical protein